MHSYKAAANIVSFFYFAKCLNKKSEQFPNFLNDCLF
jgi:hypothetical protein